MSDESRFSITFPIGAFGNHVRWLVLLDDQYRCVIKLADPQNHGLIDTDYTNDIEKLKIYPSYDFASIDSKLEFIKTQVYPSTRTWHNWLVFEWKYRNQLQEILPIDHSYTFKPNGPTSKELYLTMTPKLAVHCYLKFNSNLNATSAHFMQTTVASSNHQVRRYCLKFPENTLCLHVDALYKETLDQEFYYQLINFFGLENNYELANQVHGLWYKGHKRAEKEIITDLQKIYMENPL